MKGTIVRLNEARQFGFIKAENQGRYINGDYFFHRDDFVGHWNDMVADYHSRGKEDPIRVEFTETKTEKGFRALNVTRLDYPNQSSVEMEGI